jgi:hypothetical protein
VREEIKKNYCSRSGKKASRSKTADVVYKLRQTELEIGSRKLFQPTAIRRKWKIGATISCVLFSLQHRNN